jgi:protein-S-isoprenylcysteine O-methyltransferase Ste14
MALPSSPVSQVQVWLFFALAIGFFAVMIIALSRSGGGESGVRRNNYSRLGIILQGLGIGLAGFGPVRMSLPPLSPQALFQSLAIIVLCGGAIALFAASARALGANWSIVARTRSDHQLIRSGPYSRVRHPIYLGLLLFLLSLAVALGHFAQLMVAVPIYLAGTLIRTRIEDRLLETKFGDEFRDYARTTPAIIPRIG